MKSQKTFTEEMEAIGGIPGVLYETEADYERESGHRISDVAKWLQGFDSRDTDLSEDRDDPDDWGWLGRQPNEPLDFGPLVSGRQQQDEGSFIEKLSEATGLDIEGAMRHGSGGIDLARAVAEMGTEAFGCYLPWHAFAHSHQTPWGMYLFLEPLVGWMMDIRKNVDLEGEKLSDSDALMLAFWITYRHELFHFHVERFAIRHEVLIKNPVYRPYINRVRAEVMGTEDWLEEALAQAVVLESKLLASRMRLQGRQRKLVRRYIEQEFEKFGPGYRDFRCPKFGGVEQGHLVLSAQVVTSELHPASLVTREFTCKKEYSTVTTSVPGYLVYSSSFRSRFQLQMPKKRQFKRYISKEGHEEIGRGPGDHWKVRINGRDVQVNSKRGEIDLASMKAIAKAKEQSLWAVLDAMK